MKIYDDHIFLQVGETTQIIIEGRRHSLFIILLSNIKCKLYKGQSTLFTYSLAVETLIVLLITVTVMGIIP